MIKIFDSERKNAVENPIRVCPGLRLAKYQLNHLLVAEFLKVHVFVDLQVAVVNDLRLDGMHNDGQNLVHALSIAELRVVLCPEIQQVGHLLLGVL